VEHLPSEGFLGDLFASLATGLYATDSHGRMTAINPEGLRLLGHRDAGAVLGRNAHELLHHTRPDGTRAPAAECPLLGVIRTGSPARQDGDVFWRVDGAPLPVSWLSAPVLQDGRVSGAVVVFDDVTARRVPAALAVPREDGQGGEGGRPGPGGAGPGQDAWERARLEVLADLGGVLSRVERSDGLAGLARLPLARLASAASVDVLDQGQLVREAVGVLEAGGAAEGQAGAEEELTGPLPALTTRSAGSLARALLNGETVVLTPSDLAPGEGAERLGDPLDAVEREHLVRMGAAHVVVVPLTAQRAVLGAMTWVRADPDASFTDEDVALAEEVGRRSGWALHEARQHALERRNSELLQRSLLPPPSAPEGLELAVRYLPAASGSRVGGDWYDVFALPDGATCLAIGDVVGHDLGAAVLMGQVRSLLRALAWDRREPPSAVLRRVDEAVEGLGIAALATCVLVRLDPAPPGRARRLTWSSAGHLPLALVSPGADGPAVRLLDRPGDLMLGVDPRQPRTDHHAVLHPGSALWSYTDGLVERPGEPLDASLARLAEGLAAAAGPSLERACDQLLAHLVPHQHPDDVAVLVIRNRP
jgi:PAS domain S-box-containing protein